MTDDLRGRKPRCYIAGPIAGVPDFRERFAAAVPAVEALGYPECSIPVLAALTERAETPDAPPQTDTLWPKNPDTQGD